jgi:hypothetical protein
MALSCACTGDPSADADQSPAVCPGPVTETKQLYPQGVQAALDVLFVIDNSPSMAAHQQHLVAALPRLIQGLRSDALDGDLPDLHLGVISADLGGGGAAAPLSCQGDGDGGRLLARAPHLGCQAPTDPWIAYVDYETNVPGADRHPLVAIPQAFACIGQLPSYGCVFEQPLEAARRALDPALGLNPGFVRDRAFLLVVLVTDEDDCSARDPSLFALQDASHLGLEGWSADRCFAAGVRCEEPLSIGGALPGCRPGGSALKPVEEYVRFFQQLKPPGRLRLAAIAGPRAPVRLAGETGSTVQPSCERDGAGAVPPLRIAALLDAFGDDGRLFNLCEDYGRALAELVAPKVLVYPGHRCLPAPLLTTDGCSVACAEGALLGRDTSGAEVRCQQSCLDRVDCLVIETTHLGQPEERALLVDRCPTRFFADPELSQCGSACPCWRIVSDDRCSAEHNGSPFRFEILRERVPRDARVAELRCAVSDDALPLAQRPQCGVR